MGARRTIRALTLATLVIGFASGCGLLFDLDGLEAGGAPHASLGDAAAMDGTVGFDGNTDSDAASRADAAPGADAAHDDGPVGCPGHEGPTMVRAGAFCIDSTEVTVAQYARFTDALKTDAGGWPSIPCSWNTSFVPYGFGSSWPPDAGLQLPVTNVNWCDAYDYCRWAGKELCGHVVTNGDLSTGEAQDPKSQWASACTHDGAFVYPFGSTWMNVCNDDAFGDPAPVASYPLCQGGYPGIYDMLQNAWEWVDACDGPGQDGSCALMGGSAGTSVEIDGCTKSVLASRVSAGSGVGLRCCSRP